MRESGMVTLAFRVAFGVDPRRQIRGAGIGASMSRMLNASFRSDRPGGKSLRVPHRPATDPPWIKTAAYPRVMVAAGPPSTPFANPTAGRRGSRACPSLACSLARHDGGDYLPTHFLVRAAAHAPGSADRRGATSTIGIPVKPAPSYEGSGRGGRGSDQPRAGRRQRGPPSDVPLPARSQTHDRRSQSRQRIQECG
jgi:hypothetical protein